MLNRHYSIILNQQIAVFFFLSVSCTFSVKLNEFVLFAVTYYITTVHSTFTWILHKANRTLVAELQVDHQSINVVRVCVINSSEISHGEKCNSRDVTRRFLLINICHNLEEISAWCEIRPISQWIVRTLTNEISNMERYYEELLATLYIYLYIFF